LPRPHRDCSGSAELPIFHFIILHSSFKLFALPLLAKNKNADAKRGFRDRRKQTLFIDARKLGTLIDRVHRELTDADVFANSIPKLRRRLKKRRRAENSSTLRAFRCTSGPRISTPLPSYYFRHDQTN